jgi:hypothetical protein
MMQAKREEEKQREIEGEGWFSIYKFLLFKRMPNRARRTKGWCKPMATAALSNPEEEIVPPVKNLCERLDPQRGP